MATTKIPVITSLDQLDLNKSYTYADYLTWQFKERVELLRGKLLKMSPAPNVRHQRISSELSYTIQHFLKQKSCELFTAPFDVRLPLPGNKSKSAKIDTVVQPDICVICDEAKLDAQGCNGAPDLIIEILSPGNSKREMKDKFALYESAGVREYWIIDPVREHILVYVVDETGKFIGRQPFYAGDQIPSEVLVGFVLNTTEILHELEDF